jgi:predicted nucleic acid-binding protein
VDIAIALRKVELFGHTHLAIIDLDDVLAATDLQRLHQLSFWDALVLRAAQETGCTVFYSEDLQSGRRFNATTVRNPFR